MPHFAVSGLLDVFYSGERMSLRKNKELCDAVSKVKYKLYAV